MLRHPEAQSHAVMFMTSHAPAETPKHYNSGEVLRYTCIDARLSCVPQQIRSKDVLLDAVRRGAPIIIPYLHTVSITQQCSHNTACILDWLMFAF